MRRRNGNRSHVVIEVPRARFLKMPDGQPADDVASFLKFDHYIKVEFRRLHPGTSIESKYEDSFEDIDAVTLPEMYPHMAAEIREDTKRIIQEVYMRGAFWIPATKSSGSGERENPVDDEAN